MEEKSEIQKQFFKHVSYNIVVFICIFIIFGLVMFFMIRGLVYSSINDELYEAKENLQGINTSENLIKENIFVKNIARDTTLSIDREFLNDFQSIIRRVVNPNITVIIRDKDGNIINEELGRLSDYVGEIEYDNQNLEKIYEIIINKQYHYRGINFISENGDYIQLLMNSDSEENLILRYKEIIISSVLICSFLSIIASYILSKKTLKPLQENMIKQMEFVQNVSHELRTPLTIIQAKQELLLQEPSAKIIDKTEDIAQSLNETKRLSKLVKDLLVLSRGDAKKDSIQKENINIDEYIKEIVNPYNEIAELEEKEITYNLNYGMDINIDTSKFYQLIVILLDNALKYTETGDKIEIASSLKDNKYVLEIKDTGIGISDEGLTRVFERFYREDEARNRETGGSGLGLSLASYLVSTHGGTIKASHNNPKGTIFTIRIPK